MLNIAFKQVKFTDSISYVFLKGVRKCNPSFQDKVFWVVTPCNVVVGCQRFRGPCWLHLHGEVN